ncbi:hypothetical protein FMA36_07150 [Komagataeibacter xylinus]|uniref:Uncharacterized protein n=1 Tax=Komagataeibacter xylinus TaxID=28448 RepID=A0A857FM53_KOMXY|nr:hypothetical protein FMA36_07150 [Komagataeibacter xylinus]
MMVRLPEAGALEGDFLPHVAAGRLNRPFHVRRDGVVAVLPARHRNVPEWSLEETTARKDGR